MNFYSMCSIPRNIGKNSTTPENKWLDSKFTRVNRNIIIGQFYYLELSRVSHIKKLRHKSQQLLPERNLVSLFQFTLNITMDALIMFNVPWLAYPG